MPLARSIRNTDMKLVHTVKQECASSKHAPSDDARLQLNACGSSCALGECGGENLPPTQVWRMQIIISGSRMLSRIGITYNMANLRGFNDSTGNKAKQMTKHAKAARLQAPNTSSRSHRLTMMPVSAVLRSA